MILKVVLILCSAILGLVLVFSIVSVTSHNASVTSDDGKSWAVIFGIGQYKHLSVDEQYADNDAEEVAEQMGILWGNDHVKLMVDSSVTKENMKDTIYNWLAPKESENDIVMLFFAGHGGCEYISLYDSIEGSDVNDVNYSEFSDWMNILETKNVVIILDTCGSGSFGENLYGNFHEILTCGTKCQKCWQEDIYEHGIFSYYLIEALSDLEGVDTNQDCAVSTKELFNYVDSKIAHEFKEYPPPSLQDPQMIDSRNGELILFRIGNTITTIKENNTTR